MNLKSLLLLISAIFLLTNSNAYSGGKCTGSANCTACKNCSGCKHCKSGGSCGVCTPKKTAYVSTISTTQKQVPVKSSSGLSSKSESYSSQCRATTKKGNRCSRTSRSGGYCWQHGG